MEYANKQVLSVFGRMQRVGRLAVALVCLFASFALYAQETVVNGTVVDENNEPLIGATIMVEKTTNGTSADLDGNFTIKCKPGAKLVISYVGYQTANVAAKDGMRVVLKESSEMLDAVEVVAYGVQKKVTMTGAVSSIKSDDLTHTLSAQSTTSSPASCPASRQCNTPASRDLTPPRSSCAARPPGQTPNL